MVHLDGGVADTRGSLLFTRLYMKASEIPEAAGISDATIQMDQNAVVLFTIDRLARSPRTTVRTRGTELPQDR